MSVCARLVASCLAKGFAGGPCMMSNDEKFQSSLISSRQIQVNLAVHTVTTFHVMLYSALDVIISMLSLC